MSITTPLLLSRPRLRSSRRGLLRRLHLPLMLRSSQRADQSYHYHHTPTSDYQRASVYRHQCFGLGRQWGRQLLSGISICYQWCVPHYSSHPLRVCFKTSRTAVTSSHQRQQPNPLSVPSVRITSTSNVSFRSPISTGHPLPPRPGPPPTRSPRSRQGLTTGCTGTGTGPASRTFQSTASTRPPPTQPLISPETPGSTSTGTTSCQWGWRSDEAPIEVQKRVIAFTPT